MGVRTETKATNQVSHHNLVSKMVNHRAIKATSRIKITISSNKMANKTTREANQDNKITKETNRDKTAKATKVVNKIRRSRWFGRSRRQRRTTWSTRSANT